MFVDMNWVFPIRVKFWLTMMAAQRDRLVQRLIQISIGYLISSQVGIISIVFLPQQSNYY